MNIIEEKWDSVVDTLSTEFGFSPISINTWIKPLQVQRYDSDEGTLFIYVPIDEMGINEDFINSYINKKFTTPLRSTIAELTGLDCTKIVYTVEQNVVKEADSSSNTDNSFNNILEKANLNPEYTLKLRCRKQQQICTRCIFGSCRIPGRNLQPPLPLRRCWTGENPSDALDRTLYPGK